MGGAARVGGAPVSDGPRSSRRHARAAVTTASFRERLALLRAHPDLAGRAARAGAMSAASVAEQASAGLDRLTDEEFTRSSD